MANTKLKQFISRFNKLAKSEKISNPNNIRNFTPEKLSHKDELIIELLLDRIQELENQIKK